METVNIVAPVLVMLLLGMFCRKIKLLTKSGTDIIKKYIINIALPVNVFHAMATAEYNSGVTLIIGMMLTILFVTFGLGFVVSKIAGKPYQRYFPYLMAVYEGGMLGYPLYQNLCGPEHLSTIALIDMGCGIFSFGLYFSLLGMMESGNRITAKAIAKSAFTSPTFVAVILGLICGITGGMNAFLQTPLHDLYINVKDIIVAPISAMILLCIGFEFELNKKGLAICIKTVLMRVLMQGIMLVLAMIVLNRMDMDVYTKIGFSLYLMLPPSFCLTSFVKNEEADKYISTTISLYMIVTILAYIVIAFLM